MRTYRVATHPPYPPYPPHTRAGRRRVANPEAISCPTLSRVHREGDARHTQTGLRLDSPRRGLDSTDSTRLTPPNFKTSLAPKIDGSAHPVDYSMNSRATALQLQRGDRRIICHWKSTTRKQEAVSGSEARLRILILVIEESNEQQPPDLQTRPGYMLSVFIFSS